MTGIQHSLAALFHRDLSRLMQQIDAFPEDDLLWRKLPGVSNPAGNLVLHLEGNLREYVGRQLGKIPYSRQRALEFSSSGSSNGMGVEELSGRVSELRRIVPPTILALSQEELEVEFPEIVLDRPTSTGEFLIHLHGHLNWHLGQIDYLRRVLTGAGAIKAAGLLDAYRIE